MFKLSGDMSFIYRSTLGWYAVRYFLYASEHGQIKHLRALWHEDDIYDGVESFYNYYLQKEIGARPSSAEEWIKDRLATEDKFWEQERWLLFFRPRGYFSFPALPISLALPPASAIHIEQGTGSVSLPAPAVRHSHAL